MQKLIATTKDKLFGIALIQTSIGEDLFIVKKKNNNSIWNDDNLEIIKFLDRKFIYNNKNNMNNYVDISGDIYDFLFFHKSLCFSKL